jgi:signal peptidase II
MQDHTTNTTLQQWAILFGTALLLIVIDQIAKALVVANLQLYEAWIPIPALDAVFEITYTRNTGAAFGLLTSASNVFLVIAVIASAVIIYYYRHVPKEAIFLRIAMGLQLGGALGNAVDRLTRGFVVDFLHIYYDPIGFDWPIFNLADSAIVIGVLLLIILLGREEKRDHPETASQESGKADA